ncbi:MAG: hypothetical protein MJA83_13450 [Gammaproteobacteria bacterium]|nr:hypothetical protein [Gammaproteobacteria bacterium]
MKRNFLLILLVMSITPFSTYARDINYSFADIRYVDISVDDFEDGDGFAVRGSYAVTDNIHVFGDYLDAEVDSFDFEHTRFGVGYHKKIVFQDLSAFAQFSYEESESGDTSDEGFGLTAGVRKNWHGRFEAGAYLRYVNMDESDTLVGINGLFHVNDRFSIGLEIEDGDDVSYKNIMGRINF